MLAVIRIGDTDRSGVCVTVSPTAETGMHLSPNHRNRTYIEKVSPKNRPINPFCANARAIPGLVEGALRATKAQVRPTFFDFRANARPQLVGQKIAGLCRDKVFLYTHPVLSFPQVDGQIATPISRDKELFVSTLSEDVSTCGFVPAMVGGEAHA